MKRAWFSGLSFFKIFLRGILGLLDVVLKVLEISVVRGE